jgi:DNA polymerase III delta subunit
MKTNFSSLFKTPINKYKYFFIYGNDLVVFDRIILYITRSTSSSLDIKSEKELLAHSFQQPSLFEEPQNKSLHLVSNVTDKIISHLDQLGEGTFIFTSEKARAQSKLVTHFSASPLSLAIAAYASPLTTSEFEFLAGDLDLPASFRGLLFKAYQNDYMGLLAAFEKIKLYGDVPESAYPSFLESSSPSDDLQSLIHPLLLKNLKMASEILSTVNSADLILALRSLLRAFQTLYELMPYKDRPDSIIWQKLTPPIFFKDQPIYQAALSKWSVEQVKGLLETLLELEYKVKYEKLSLSQLIQELMKKAM